MAPLGQLLSQDPQSMQASGRMQYTPLAAEYWIASCGQASAQAPQPAHFDSTIP